jgi:hypothetical protein
LTSWLPLKGSPVSGMNRVLTEGLGGPTYGYDVGRWNICLHIVRWCQNVAATGCKGPQPQSHFLLNFLFRSKGENVLFVHSTVERDAVAEFSLELVGSHSGGARLHRIEYLEAYVEKIRYQRADASAAMKHDLYRRVYLIEVLPRCLPSPPEVR